MRSTVGESNHTQTLLLVQAANPPLQEAAMGLKGISELSRFVSDSHTCVAK